MSDLSSLIGRTISFRYPAHNFNVPGIPRTTERRCARIENVRDCREFPIEAETRALNPHLNRGNFLLETYDFDRHGTRHFYFEAMQDVVIEHGEPAEEEDEQPTTPQAVFVVDRPEDWTPAGPGDVPPNVERIERSSPQLAAVFARHFNELEMGEPSGRWAVR